RRQNNNCRFEVVMVPNFVTCARASRRWRFVYEVFRSAHYRLRKLESRVTIFTLLSLLSFTVAFTSVRRSAFSAITLQTTETNIAPGGTGYRWSQNSSAGSSTFTPPSAPPPLPSGTPTLNDAARFLTQTTDRKST